MTVPPPARETDRHASGRRALVTVALLAVPVLLGLLLAAGHLADPVWYDEAYTLDYFATDNPADAFTDYHAPNNHILFSALLSAWNRLVMPEGEVILLRLRILPLLLFGLATALITLAGWRIGGREAGLLVGLLFATSHVTQNYAAQLRGYGFSWIPVAAGLLCAWWDFRNPRWWAVTGFVLTGAVAVGTVPTNGLVVGILAAWRILLDVPEIRRLRAGALLRYTAFGLAPLPGLLVYAGVWDAFLQQLRSHETSYTVLGNTGQWWWWTLVDLWWLCPVLAGGAFLTLRREPAPAESPPLPVRERAPTRAAGRAGLRLLLASAVLPPLGWLLLAHVPYPRTLVPLLPAWYLGWGLLAGGVLATLRQWSAPAARIALAVLVLLLVGTALRREATRADYITRVPRGEKPFTLYDQYPHDPRFDPAAVVRWLREASQRRPLFVLTDETDLWALVHELGFYPPDPRLHVVYYKHPNVTREKLASVAAGRLVLLLTRNRQEALRMKTYHDMPGRLTPALYDGGFFQVYGVVPEEETEKRAEAGSRAERASAPPDTPEARDSR